MAELRGMADELRTKAEQDARTHGRSLGARVAV